MRLPNAAAQRSLDICDHYIFNLPIKLPILFIVIFRFKVSKERQVYMYPIIITDR